MTVKFQKFIASPLSEAKDWVFNEIHLLSDYLWTLTDSMETELQRLEDKIDEGGEGTAHDNLSGVTPDQHHSQVHDFYSADHSNIPTSFPPGAHTHLEPEILDLDKYTRADVDRLVSEKSQTYEGVSEDNSMVDGDMWLQTEDTSIPPPIFTGTIPDIVIAIGVPITPYDCSTHFTDVTNYYLQHNPAWLVIDPVTGILSGTPDTLDPYKVIVVGENVSGATSSNEINVP